MLDVKCPACGETYHVSEQHVGRSLRCRKCERVFTIAAPSMAGATSAAGTSSVAGSSTAASSGWSSAGASTGQQAGGQAGPATGTAQASREPIVVTDQDFGQKVLQSPRPVLVDFWAAWCGPCRAIAPMVEQLAQEYAGKVTFAKLNADENPRMMSRYGVRGIPTLLLFKGGQEVGRLVGLQPKAAITRALDQVA